MLALTRRRNERVFIGTEIVVTVVDVHVGDAVVPEGQVRLSFQAPRAVPINRQEVAERKAAGSFPSGRKKAAPQRPGHSRAIPDATVRLQVRLPQDIPVYRSRQSRDRSKTHCQIESLAPGRASGPEETTPSRRTEIDVECRKGESILIGMDVVITVAAVSRFVFSARRPVSSP